MSAINLVDLRQALTAIAEGGILITEDDGSYFSKGSRVHRAMLRLAEMGEAILERAPFQPVARLSGSVVIDREAFEKIETEAAVSAALLRQVVEILPGYPPPNLKSDLLHRAEALEAAFLACRPSSGAPVRS